ncbi:hypothetical protein KEM54_006150 [Ascosphaera aggregata]|nr:hypothetical protein KEM54_006150 [Ascosphaera aggregata]
MSSDVTNTIKETIKTPARQSPSKIERTQSSIGDGRRVYDIPTLLSIGRRLGSKSDPVVLNVIPDAVPSGRRRGESVLKEKSLNRHSRGCSGSSSGSSTFQETVRRASHRVPSRQPTHPPQGTLAQSNAGFAKFLKEHTSPKHQRVTAGGRIVPFELDTKAAPEFKLPAKEEKNTGQRSPSSQGPKFPPKGKQKLQEKPNQGADNFKPKPIPVVGGSPFDSASTGVSHGGQNARPSSPGHVRNLSFPNPAAPLFQPSSDGSPAPNSFNYLANGADQSNWSTASCFSAMSQPPQPPVIPGIYNFGIPTCTPPVATQAAPQVFQLPSNPGMLNNVVPGTSAPLPIQPVLQPWASAQALEEATKEFENISKELEDLDRYLAIRFQIDPTAKRILVEQRMELVEKKNVARAAKEWIEQTLEATTKQGIIPSNGDRQPIPQPQQPMPETAAAFSQGLNNQPASWIPNLIPSTMSNYTGPTGYPTPIPNQNIFLPPFQQVASPIPALGGFTAQLPTSLVEKQLPFKATDAVDRHVSATADSTVMEREKVWDRAPENAPPEIMRVYQNLEDAVKRGADLEPHLQELSKAILNLKHKRSVIQRQRNASREVTKEGSTGPRNKSSDSDVNVLATTAVNEKVQNETSSRKASGSGSNEKRRFRKKNGVVVSDADAQALRESRQNRKESKKVVGPTSSTSAIENADDVAGVPPRSSEPTKHDSSSSTYTNRGSSSATSEQTTSPPNSRLRYDAATFMPLKQQAESQLKAAKASTVHSPITAYWTPPAPAEEAAPRLAGVPGGEATKSKEPSSGGFFGWFRRALSPSPESQGAKGFVQNLRQGEREGRKNHSAKHAPKVRAS